MGKERIKIVFLTHAYPCRSAPLNAKFIMILANKLAEVGNEIFVLVPRTFFDSPYYEEKNNVKIVRFDYFSSERLLSQHRSMFSLELFSLLWSGITFARQFIQDIKPDILHSHFVLPMGFIGVYLQRRFKVPHIVTAHGTDILSLPKRSFVFRGLISNVLKRADRITVPARHIMNNFPNQLKAKTTVVPMGVDLQLFRYSTKKENIIVSTRSFYDIYDIQTLLKAFSKITAKYPFYRLVLAGDGPLRKSLEDLASELGIGEKTFFLGAMEHNELAELLFKSKIYVSTSLSDGASVSLLEALSCGALPVVSNIPANREWISCCKNGFLFVPSDPEDLAKKLERAIEEYDAFSAALEENRKLIEKEAGWDIVVEKFLSIYKEIINKSDG